MKAKNVTIILVATLFCLTSALYAEPKSTDTRPYIGVLLDPTPLPELLTKHLGLSPGQGVMIKNVQCDSPADKAGLERDDIIVGFQSQDVIDCKEFVDVVQEAGAGSDVSLEIIHLGKHKTVKLKLSAQPTGGLQGKFDWKYPLEPEIVQSWRPGKIFRLKSGDKDWMELNIPEFEVNLNKFFKELRSYGYSDGGESYTVTIEGDPNDEDTRITVRVGDAEYKTTVKEIDRLPDKYRSIAEEALQDARKSSKAEEPSQKSYLHWLRPSFQLKDYFKDLYRPKRPQAPPFEQGNEILDNIEKQIRRLQQRVEELEKRQGETFDHFPDKSDRQESEEQDKPVRQEEQESQKV